MLESFEGNKLDYKKLSSEEMETRGILGRLVGPICDTTKETRNGRKYSKELWENAINNDIFQEKLKNRCVFAELGHPVDRTEVDIEKAAAALAEQPKVGKDGKLYGVWDILNTPNGKILKTLCDYGTTIGISSRGEGDITEDYDGNETVDPDTYSLETFDMVILPAVKDARMQYVTESLNKKKYNKTLREKLSEQIKNAEGNDKEVMQETLEKLDINLEEKLVEPEADDLKPIEDKFAELGLEIEAKGKTLFDNVHYQLRKELDHKVTKEDLGPIFDALCDLNDHDIMPVTCNVGVHRDGDNIISASVDVDKKYVSDDENINEDVSVTKRGNEDDADHYNSATWYIGGKNNFEVNTDSLSLSNKVQYTASRWTHTYKNIQEMEDDIKNLQSMVDIVKDLEAKGITNSLNRFAENESLKEDVNPSLETVVVNSIVDMINSTDENDKDGINKALSHIISFCKDLANDYDVILEEEAKEVHERNKEEVVDNQSEDLLSELQEALKDKSDLEVSVADVQNKLAVSDAKVESLNEELSKYKDLSARLSSKAQESKELSKKISTLEESITAKDTEIKKLKSGRLLENRKSEHKCKKLEESISNGEAEKQKLTEDLNNANNKIDTLSKEIEEIKSTSSLKEKESNEKLAKLNTLVEAYKKVANSTMKRYIESKATMYGISFKDIRDRLPDSYTADDVDKICEGLRTYNVNMNRLPINVKPRLRFTESKNDALRVNLNPADEIDDDLIELAKLG